MRQQFLGLDRRAFAVLFPVHYLGRRLFEHALTATALPCPYRSKPSDATLPEKPALPVGPPIRRVSRVMPALQFMAAE